MCLGVVKCFGHVFFLSYCGSSVSVYMKQKNNFQNTDVGVVLPYITPQEHKKETILKWSIICVAKIYQSLTFNAIYVDYDGEKKRLHSIGCCLWLTTTTEVNNCLLISSRKTWHLTFNVNTNENVQLIDINSTHYNYTLCMVYAHRMVSFMQFT